MSPVGSTGTSRLTPPRSVPTSMRPEPGRPTTRRVKRGGGYDTPERKAMGETVRPPGGGGEEVRRSVARAVVVIWLVPVSGRAF